MSYEPWRGTSLRLSHEVRQERYRRKKRRTMASMGWGFAFSVVLSFCYFATRDAAEVLVSPLLAGISWGIFAIACFAWGWAGMAAWTLIEMTDGRQKAKRWLLAQLREECCGNPRCYRSNVPYMTRHPRGAAISFLAILALMSALMWACTTYESWAGLERGRVLSPVAGGGAMLAAVTGFGISVWQDWRRRRKS